MNILQNVPLIDYSTMRLGGSAAYLVEVDDRNDVAVAVDWAEERQLPIIMIGIGSNIVWSDKGFSGLVVVDKILHFAIQEDNTESAYVIVGGGEVWDSVVSRTVEAGLTGIEALSLIPGTTGATPIQNVGAYGQEIADTLVSVEAYDKKHHQFVTIAADECGFGYRTSRFKTTDRGRFLITSVTLHLHRGKPPRPYYPAVEVYLKEHHLNDVTSTVLRDAVTAIRTSKLPDPRTVANNGSFFANPVITANKFKDLVAQQPQLRYWPVKDGNYKISAAWLVEQAGFKSAHDAETGMATWPNQALVLVNEHAHNTADLLRFKQKITDKVEAMFGIKLLQEPEMIGEGT